MLKDDRILAHVKTLVRHPVMYVQAFLSPQRPSGVDRWQEPASLDPEWDDRTRLLASFIEPNSSVIEFGAGRLALKEMLPPGCTYRPADIVARSPDTLVFDLNGEYPELSSRYDYAVLSGVLDYVEDLPRLFRWLAATTRIALFSYAITDRLHDPVTRRRSGWVNHFSHDGISSIAAENGWSVSVLSDWQTQRLYVGHSQLFDASRQSATA